VNGKLRRRIEGLERSLAPALNANLHDEMMQLALSNVSTQDLHVLLQIAESGKQQGEWTEREVAAVRAVSSAYDQEVIRAGYPSIAVFQRSAKLHPKASCTTR
jgi:hypothetical protein